MFLGGSVDALIARLALARGWISQEAYHLILQRSGGREVAPGLLVEDDLRAAGLTGEQIRTLCGALRIQKKEVWIGDWRLLRRVGIGGMGSVFEARHRRTGRRVALKILLPRLGRDPEFTARFLREAQALARFIPLTYFLEYFRHFYGFPLNYSRPLLYGFSLSVIYILASYALLHYTLKSAYRRGILLRLSE